MHGCDNLFDFSTGIGAEQRLGWNNFYLVLVRLTLEENREKSKRQKILWRLVVINLRESVKGNVNFSNTTK